jgi:ADP-ribose pyrophosphatase
MTGRTDIEIKYCGKYLQFIVDQRWEYVDRINAAAVVVIVAVTDDDEWLLVEQYRAPVGRNVIEMPAGLVGDIPGEEDEAIFTAAKRELLEETGYEAGKVVFLTAGPPSSGQSTEIVHLYLATQLRKIHDGGGDGTENITVHHVPLAQAEQWLQDIAAKGYAVDPKNYSGLFFARQGR